MKKVLFIVCIAMSLVMSCEQDSIRSEGELKDDSLLLDSNRNTSRCLYNETPFANQLVTFTTECDNLPNYGCFEDELQLAIESEIYNYYNTNFNGPRPVEVFIEYISIPKLFLDTIIDTSDLFPFISAGNANSVYLDVTCDIVSYINTLPALTGNDFYGINIISLNVALPFSGPEDAWLEYSYEIIIYDY